MDGQPALVREELYANGWQVTHIEHYRDGFLQDPLDGSPALCSYDDTTDLLVESHYVHGRLNDPLDGSPARRTFRSDGSIACEEHFLAGRAIASVRPHAMV